jgi:hypothetical protein
MCASKSALQWSRSPWRVISNFFNIAPTDIHSCAFEKRTAPEPKILDPKHSQRAATQEANYGLYPNAGSSSSSAPRSNRAPNSSEIGASAERPVFPASSLTAAAARTLHRGENVVRSVSTEPTLVRWHRLTLIQEVMGDASLEGCE